MKVGVIVASIGRPHQLGELLSLLEKQTARADGIILSLEKASDAPIVYGSNVEVIFGSKGASLQRNRAIDRAIELYDLLIFFDDDFVPTTEFIKNAKDLFSKSAYIAGATGYVIRDGVTSGGIPFDRAEFIATEFEEVEARRAVVMKDVRYAYGCNMIFRSSAIGEIRFDENLPLHSWQEDVDFAAQVRMKGQMIYTNAFAGVHRGVTHGRSPGKKVGYAQIANPTYLYRKGTMRLSHAARILLKNVVANHLKLLKPEQHIDRFGRVKGNWAALIDLAKGKCDPRNIIDL